MPRSATLSRPFFAKMPMSRRLDAFQDVLHRVALTVNSSLEIREVLERLADLTLEALQAERCNLLLLDDSGERLTPTFSIGKVTDESLLLRFKDLEPIDLKAVPARWHAVFAGRAFGIPDMAASPLVPPEIVEIFGSRSALVAPLVASGEALGVLCLDWTAPGRDFSEDEVALFEAIGVYAALAIRNARLFQRLAAKARTLQSMMEVGAALNSSPSLKTVLELICSAFQELLGTTHCSVNLLDEAVPGGVRTLAVRGVSWFTANPESLGSAPAAEVERVRNLWEKSPEPVIYEDPLRELPLERSLIPPSVRSVVLFPLVGSEGVNGFIIAGFPNVGAPMKDEIETGRALAEQAATAIARASLHENLRKRLHRVELLYRLSDVVSGTEDLSAAIRRLNRVLRPELGIRLKGIFLSNPKVREAVGGSPPGPEELEAIRSWRSSLSKGRRPLVPRRSKSFLLLPVVYGRKVVGAVAAQVDEASPAGDEGLLAAIASGCAEVVYKASLRRHLLETERRLAISAERDRIARDLHDSVTQLFTSIGMKLAEYIPEIPDPQWQRRLHELMKMAATGSLEVRQAIYALLFLQVRRRGLVRSLKELAQKFEATTGISVRLRLEGEPEPILAGKEDALFRVAHEALMNIERHSGATLVTIGLTYGTEAVCLRIRDDGIGLSEESSTNRSGRDFGLRNIEQMMDEVGGCFSIKNASPRGVTVRARVPKESKRRRRSRS